MLLLSRFPINHFASRTFQHFLWRDMPNATVPKHPSGEPWYDDEDLAILPLSSKSHWDVVVELDFPKSAGGVAHFPKVNKAYSASHTAIWRMQAVFWLDSRDPQFSFLKNTSDHRLVYLDLVIET